MTFPDTTLEDNVVILDLDQERNRYCSLLSDIPQGNADIELAAFDHVARLLGEYYHITDKRPKWENVFDEDKKRLDDLTLQGKLVMSEEERIAHATHTANNAQATYNTGLPQKCPSLLVAFDYDQDDPIHQKFYLNGIKHGPGVGKHIFDSGLEHAMRLLAYQDKAMLIDTDGVIARTFVTVPGLQVFFDAYPHLKPENGDGYDFLRKCQGFNIDKVGTRHDAGITTSFLVPGSVILTVSEESGHIRRFEDGKITYSTVPGEPYGLQGPSFLEKLEKAMAKR